MEISTETWRWHAAHWPFVREHLPSPPARVLELGCGPTGGFVPVLRESGYAAEGVDPEAPAEPGFHRTVFEKHHPGPVDAILASTSLHHVDDLGTVLDHAAELLRPGGVLVVIEWAYERFDEATARWCFDRLPGGNEASSHDDRAGSVHDHHDEGGWLQHHRDLWIESGQAWPDYIEEWGRQEKLHHGDAMIEALQQRFETSLVIRAPYFFAGLAAGEDDEQAAAAAGEIQATGIRYVGAKPVGHTGGRDSL